MPRQGSHSEKPLGHKAYGSIPHLPNSRLGPADRYISPGQARICTEKARDRFDRIIVQEKLDGSCTAVALLQGRIVPLGRAGYPADSSPFRQHHMFAEWVRRQEARFRAVLQEGERLVGEWLAQAHGTMYDLRDREPWAVFDLMLGRQRVTQDELQTRLDGRFSMPHTLHRGGPLPVERALELLADSHWPCDAPEGVVYRVERRNRVDFLAKWVRPDKTDGKYLPCITGGDAVWLWPVAEPRETGR